MRTVQVGFGNAARYHRNDFPKEVEVIGSVDIDFQKRQLIESQGFKAFSEPSVAFVSLSDKVDFWDICVPTEVHLLVVRDLLQMGATRLIVEKPICLPSEIEEMEKLLQRFPQAKLCVQEQYLSSEIVKMLRKKCKEYGVAKPKILMEQSKNRMEDIIKGRFIDRELGVFGYETPHAIVAIAGTGENRLPEKIQSVSIEDMILPNGDRLPKQGKGEISYLTQDGCQVKLFTAMNGEVGYPLSEVHAPKHIPYGDPLRYRVLVLEEGNKKIIGQFEPISGWPRFKGRVLVYVNGALQEELEVKDRSIKQHLNKVIPYFRGEGENPAPPQVALQIVRFLNEIMGKI